MEPQLDNLVEDILHEFIAVQQYASLWKRLSDWTSFTIRSHPVGSDDVDFARIGSIGGTVAHERGTARHWNSETARAAALKAAEKRRLPKEELLARARVRDRARYRAKRQRLDNASE